MSGSPLSYLNIGIVLRPYLSFRNVAILLVEKLTMQEAHASHFRQASEASYKIVALGFKV